MAAAAPAGALNRSFYYVRRPVGEVTAACYELREEAMPVAGRGEIVCRTLYWSVDPYQRIQQAASDSWEGPHPLGTVQGGGTVGVVVAVGDALAAPRAMGDLVLGYGGWTEHFVARADATTLLAGALAAAPSRALGSLGMPARTAYFGLLEAGRLRPSDTVVVSGAAGAVGCLVLQIARIHGSRVVGIAGSDAKCAWLRDELGAHATINYKTHSDVGAMRAALAAAAPEGVDVCVAPRGDGGGARTAHGAPRAAPQVLRQHRRAHDGCNLGAGVRTRRAPRVCRRGHGR